MKLSQSLQAAMLPASLKTKAWVKRITFIVEQVLRKQEEISLHDDRIYYVFVGKLAVGKRIVEEQEFIIGKQGRKATALRTTSLITLVTNM